MKVQNCEILNKWFSWLNIKLIINLLLILILLKYNFVLWFIYTFFNYSTLVYYSPVIIFTQLKKPILKFYHSVIVISLVISLYMQELFYIEWNLPTNSLINQTCEYGRSIFRNNVHTENIYILDSVIFLTQNHYTNTSSFLFLYTSFENQFFFLSLNESVLVQSVYNHTYNYMFKVSTYDNSSVLVDSCFIIFLIISIYILSIKFKIIF